MHATADVHVALADVSSRTGKQRCGIERLRRPGKLNSRRRTEQLEDLGAHDRHSVTFGIQRGDRLGVTFRLAPRADADQPGQDGYGGEADPLCYAATMPFLVWIGRWQLLLFGWQDFRLPRRYLVHWCAPGCISDGCYMCPRSNLPKTEYR